MSLTLKKKRYGLLLLLALLSFFPFLMKLGISSSELQKNAVQEIYHKWKWSSYQDLPFREGTNINFRADPMHPELSEVFLAQLSRDFSLDPREESNFVELYFSVNRHLHIRLEGQISGEKVLWSESQRLVNNGIIAAPWFATLLYAVGVSLGSALLLALLLLLLWTSGWSLLGAFSYIFEEIRGVFLELYLRFLSLDFYLWSQKSLSFYFTLSVLLGVYLCSVFSIGKRFFHKTSWLFLPLLFEPLILYFAAEWNHWTADVSIVKVYFSSLAYRFFTLSLIFYLWTTKLPLFRVDSFSGNSVLPAVKIFFPLVLVLSGFNSWLSAVMVDFSHESLFRLKIFFVAFLLSFILANRLLALFLMSLVFAYFRLPETGHWNAGLEWAFLFEGIFSGWVLSPFKYFQEDQAKVLIRKEIALLVLSSFVLGVFLSSMGAPLYFSWLLIFTANWAFLHLREGLNTRGSSETF